MAGLLTMVVATPVFAVDFPITAIFKPDSAKPNENRFTNTTPVSGYCAIYPGACESVNMFSLELPIRFDSAKALEPEHASPRDGAMFSVPAQWRPLTVMNARTGEQETVEIRISGIGSRYVLSQAADELAGGPSGHYLLWNGSWVYAPAPCQYSGVGGYNSHAYRFFWKTPVTGVCAKQAQFRIPSMYYESLGFAYELRTPNPLGMSSGQYTGYLTYTVGPGMDFDMGDVMIPNDSAINLSFTLDVQHTLKIEVPPGGNRVELVPEGGWQAWLNRGRKPGRLLRDQTFNISASSRFKMQMECQYAAGDTCAIEDTAGNRVPLQVAVSLPAGLGREDGSPVHRQSLKLSGVGTQLFQPRFYVDRTPGTLHFEVQRADVEQMLGRDATTYKGNVTVIWDSEV
ncbi:MAG TPA: hypothetical protein VH303_25910 [Pseudomonas sp.]|nr:hypothetical protein [Pseudomonas sp.]HEX4551838.1 hypothetical protein [Pseudomonas sp.]